MTTEDTRRLAMIYAIQTRVEGMKAENDERSRQNWALAYSEVTFCEFANCLQQLATCKDENIIELCNSISLWQRNSTINNIIFCWIDFKPIKTMETITTKEGLEIEAQYLYLLRADRKLFSYRNNLIITDLENQSLNVVNLVNYLQLRTLAETI